VAVAIRIAAFLKLRYRAVPSGHIAARPLKCWPIRPSPPEPSGSNRTLIYNSKQAHSHRAVFVRARGFVLYPSTNEFSPHKLSSISDQTMLRLGIVDLDSSHSVEFSRRFNHAGVDREQWVEGAQVVAAWSGGSVMAPERVPGFQAELDSIGVEIVDSHEQLMEQIDGVLILSLCGDCHLERARPFLEAGMPTFVDKPFACSVSDAREIIAIAEKNQTTLLNSSALRFSQEVKESAFQKQHLGNTNGAITYGPAKRADGNPGLFHYGIHSVELLFELLGSGCETVSTIWSDEAEVVTGVWADGRIGTVRGNRTGVTSYGFVAFCDDGVVSETVSTRFAYRNLCREIVRTFESKQPSVTHESNLDVVRFVLASLNSERSGGQPVSLRDIN
jgi:virulence factor